MTGEHDPRENLPTLLLFAAIGIFALFGASARLFYRYDATTPAVRRIGQLMASVFAAWLVGLLLWEQLAARPALLLGLTGMASWAGAEGVDALVRRRGVLATAEKAP